MTSARLVAIGFIYVCTAIAWFVLGGTIVQRTGESDDRLAHEVAQLWGGHHQQNGPQVVVFRPGTVVENVPQPDGKGGFVQRPVVREVEQEFAVAIDESRVKVDLQLDQRRKGLLWYDTYGVALDARYRFKNPDAERRRVRVLVAFPSTEAIYDGFVFRVNGREAAAVTDLSAGAPLTVELEPGEQATVELAYRSRGLGEWLYAFGNGSVSQVRNFDLQMTTDFDRIDFPGGTLSPTSRERTAQGWKLGWRFDSLVTGQKIGMDAPNRLNPGPFAARVTFFAPVSLLFFVTVLVILGALRGRSLHPVNYFFLSAAFFAFHLLLAYLVDHVDVNAAFAIAAATSVALVVSYLRLVAGMRYALLEAGLAQVVFLVLFSYAFFFEGYTGLTVTVGAVITLFVLMQVTGRVDWGAKLARREEAPVR
jgi:inner membrane protein involved in colicin E2 resistance